MKNVNEVVQRRKRVKEVITQMKLLKQEKSEDQINYLLKLISNDFLTDFELLLENENYEKISPADIESILEYFETIVNHTRVMIDITQTDISQNELISILNIHMFLIESVHNICCDLGYILTSRNFEYMNDGLMRISNKIKRLATVDKE